MGDREKARRCPAWGTAAAGMLALALASRAEAAVPLDLSSLQVFATHAIQGSRSDYQGPTAAGGAVDLSDFDIDGDLVAGGPVRFSRGQVHGAVRSPDIRLDRVFASRAIGRTPGDLSRVSMQLDTLGAQLACVPATIAATTTRGSLLGETITMVRLTAVHDFDVADLSARDLQSDGPNRLRIVLTGNPRSHVVIRVRGSSASLQDVGFATRGGITPRQVVFAFPDATALTVASSGGAVAEDGTEWGVPGSIVAPNADLRLAAATVTGQVFVRSIAPIDGLPSGQINRFRAIAAGEPFEPSAVIQGVRTAVPQGCAAR